MHTPTWAHYFTMGGYILLAALITWAMAIPAMWRIVTILICAVVIAALMGPPRAVNEAERGELVSPVAE